MAEVVLQKIAQIGCEQFQSFTHGFQSIQNLTSCIFIYLLLLFFFLHVKAVFIADDVEMAPTRAILSKSRITAPQIYTD